MSVERPIRTAHVQTPGEGQGLWFLDNLLTVKVSRDDGSPFGVLVNTMPAGSHTPMHAHDREDEAFWVLEGQLTLFLGEDRVVEATPGTYVHVPAGVAHGFRTSTPVKMLVLCGGEGFVEMAREAGGPALRRELPPAAAPDKQRLGEACARWGIRLLGPLPDEREGLAAAG